MTNLRLNRHLSKLITPSATTLCFLITGLLFIAYLYCLYLIIKDFLTPTVQPASIAIHYVAIRFLYPQTGRKVVRYAKFKVFGHR